MWGEQPPATAVKTVQVYVSHLRRALVEDVVSSSRGGYVLAVDAERIDALRFERLLDEGRAALSGDDPARAAELLRAALALWRGRALGDFAYERFAQDERARLEELRLAAVEERIEADLRLGRHVEVVPELEGLVREQPVRERLRAQHMLALYRSGRQADALESFRDARRSLTEELGLEPGRELRELEQAILTQAPELDPPRARRAAAPAARRRGLALIAAGIALAGVAAAVAIAVNVRAATPSPCGPTRSPSSTPTAVGWSRTCRSAPARKRSRPTRARSGSPTSRTAPCRRSTPARDASKQSSLRRTWASKGSPSAAVPPGSPTAAAGQAVRLDAESGAEAEAMPFPTLNTGIHSETPNAAAFGHGSLWVASARLAAVFRIDAASRRVRARFDVGNNPTGIAVGAGAVWVTDSNDNTLRRIVAAGDGVVTDTIPLGNGPGPSQRARDAIWVANSRDGTVTRIDPATRAVEARIAVGRRPSGIAVGAGAVWVANSLSGTVSRIDPRTNRVTKTIEVGGMPRSVAVAGGRVWVSVQEPPPRPAPERGPAVLRMLIEEDTPSNASGLVERATAARDLRAADDLREPRRRRTQLVPEVATAAPAVSNGGRTYRSRSAPGIASRRHPANRSPPPRSSARSSGRCIRARARSASRSSAPSSAPGRTRPAAPTRSPACGRAETGSRFA